MAKFFIPETTDDESRDKVWNDIKQFANKSTGWYVTDRKILKLNFVHDSKGYEAEVGQNTNLNKELVCAIL
jgi:hypothetical protein